MTTDVPPRGRPDGPIAAVLFDLDGTLVNSERVTADAFREAWGSCGLSGQAPVADLFRLAGRPFESICRELELPASMGEAFRSASRRFAWRLRLFPGIPKLVRDLVEAGMSLGVITGKDRPRTLEVLRQLGLYELVAEIVTPDDPPAPKPSPDGVLWLCRRMLVPPGRCVLVGDSPTDIKAGLAAGTKTIGCEWGVSSADVLVQAGADATVRTVTDLAVALGFGRDYMYQPSERVRS